MSIYLDNQATTPCDPRVVEAMMPWFGEFFGNPHSAEHVHGRHAADAVEDARRHIAVLIGAEPREVVLTSGATEANNLAIKGAARFAGNEHRRRIITVATEHKCVLESVRDLAAEGFEPVILPVQANGLLDPDVLRDALRTPTLLVSVMAVNNETGIVQDLRAIADLVNGAGAILHSDLAQAAGRIPVDVAGMGLGLASLSGHKIYGPKGIGALYVRRRPRVRLTPLFSGGGQERGLRSGTVPAPLAVGFGEAARLAALEMDSDAERIGSLRDRLARLLADAIPGLRHNNGGAPRIAGNLSLRFPGIGVLDLLAACPGVSMSTGSACTSADIAPSHVLTAMGLSRAEAAMSLRLGIGRFTSAADITHAAAQLVEACRTLMRVQHPTPAEA